MRLFICLFGLSFFLASCGTQRSSNNEEKTQLNGERNEDSAAVDEQVSNSDGFEVQQFRGKVLLSKEECSVKIILESENNTCYYPVNLKEEFKVDGAYLEFQKYPSRAPLPPGCESCQAIAVENVVRLKH